MSYDEFINNILESRGRFACGDEYYERHHIVPRCMGGTDDKNNLIDLFAREHFEAHRMLALENPENDKLTYAWWAMSRLSGSSQKRYVITAEEYEEVRIRYAAILSKNMTGDGNPFYGKRHDEETKRKMRENHADLSGSNSILSKSVLQYDINGTFIKEWDCITTAANELNIDRHMISKCLTGENITTHRWKYMWFYKEDFTYDKVIDKINKFNQIKEDRRIRALIDNPAKRAVRCIETGKVYESMTEAAKDTGAQRSKISQVCSGNRKTAGGYHWEYAYEPTH